MNPHNDSLELKPSFESEPYFKSESSFEPKPSSFELEINLHFAFQPLKDFFDLDHRFGCKLLEDDHDKDRIQSSKIVETFCDQSNQFNSSLPPFKERSSNKNRDNKEMEDIASKETLYSEKDSSDLQ